MCEFGNSVCNIKFHNISVDLGHLQGDLYLLSLDDNYSVMNVCDAMHKRKRDNKTSSKLWHCRLGHISRGRMEVSLKMRYFRSYTFQIQSSASTALRENMLRLLRKERLGVRAY